MPAFPINHIAVMLRLACAKEQVPLTRQGMDALDEAIDDQYRPKDQEITVRYLDERLLKPVLEATKTGASTLKTGQPRIDKICNFIGFRDYEGFSRAWSLVAHYLKPDSWSTHGEGLQFICARADEALATKLYQSAKYPEQKSELISPRVLHELDTEALSTMLHNAQGILCIPKAWLKPEFAPIWNEWLCDAQQRGQLCPIWNADIENVKQLLPNVPKEQLLSAESYCGLATQYLIYHLEQASPRDEELSHGSSTFHITNSGAVFTGNPNITGKYISSRDMTININENSDD